MYLPHEVYCKNTHAYNKVKTLLHIGTIIDSESFSDIDWDIEELAVMMKVL